MQTGDHVRKEKPAIKVKGGRVEKNEKYVRASQENRQAKHPMKHREEDMKCGQDTAILGIHGLSGGHAGFGL